ncbi:MAG: glycine cleavage system protein GcvH [Bernardetiaceae bacterium]|nr:glycine cleavage system protein GcvH [Bernardetiaceae bacterium]
MNFPENLRYTEEHEWVRLENDGTMTIGITDFAQSELGDIVYVEVDTVGDTIEGGEVFGSIEAVKTVSDLYMPVSGEILEFNEAIEDNPEIVNTNPYKGGWLIKIKPENADDLENLMTAEEYRATVE